MHGMTKIGKALREAEELANLLQENRGTSARRWIWERGEYSLTLYPRVPVNDDETDMLACGEVLHLVRSMLSDDGWDVATTRNPGGAAVVSLEVQGKQAAHHDELLAAILADQDERRHTSPVLESTTAILLNDAAVEHGAELTMLTAAEVSASGVRISRETKQSWEVVPVGHRPREEATAAVISTSERTPLARLRAGEAWADIQLTAAVAGLEVAPLDDEELAVLGELSAGSAPQQAFIVVRPGKPAPRRLPRQRTNQSEQSVPTPRQPA